MYITSLNGKSSSLHAHLFLQDFGPVMSQILVGLVYSCQSIHWKQTWAKVKEYHASAGRTSTRRHRRETNAVESPIPRFDHREQGWGVFTNGYIGKGITIQLAAPNIIQLALSIIYPENSKTKF